MAPVPLAPLEEGKVPPTPLVEKEDNVSTPLVKEGVE
jgi:hypothetical protein